MGFYFGREVQKKTASNFDLSWKTIHNAAIKIHKEKDNGDRAREGIANLSQFHRQFAQMIHTEEAHWVVYPERVKIESNQNPIINFHSSFFRFFALEMHNASVYCFFFVVALCKWDLLLGLHFHLTCAKILCNASSTYYLLFDDLEISPT